MKVLTTSKMAIGEIVTITVNDVVEGKFGANYIATVNGEETEVRPSGNLKFLGEDIAKGKKSLFTAYSVTRIADKQGVSKSGQAYTASQFTILPAASTTSAAQAATSSVAEKLAAIRAKRGTTA